MRKRKVIYIESCWSCPHLDRGIETYFCSNRKLRVPNREEEKWYWERLIPNNGLKPDCPLEDEK